MNLESLTVFYNLEVVLVIVCSTISGMHQNVSKIKIRVSATTFALVGYVER